MTTAIYIDTTQDGLDLGNARLAIERWLANRPHIAEDVRWFIEVSSSKISLNELITAVGEGCISLILAVSMREFNRMSLTVSAAVTDLDGLKGFIAATHPLRKPFPLRWRPQRHMDRHANRKVALRQLGYTAEEVRRMLGRPPGMPAEEVPGLDVERG